MANHVNHVKWHAHKTNWTFEVMFSESQIVIGNDFRFIFGEVINSVCWTVFPLGV